MMLDINMCITFLPVQNKYPDTRFICQNFDNKRFVDNLNVQVADEIKRDIWKFLISSDVAYNYVYNIPSCAKKYPATRVICQNFYNKRDINNQKVQVADEIKHDIWKYLVSSDVSGDA